LRVFLQYKSSLKKVLFTKSAFTLIELLVVVLIIGILAAIALPQYLKSIEKSKASEALVWGAKIKSAEEFYYLQSGGSYTTDWTKLDIPCQGTLKTHNSTNDTCVMPHFNLMLEFPGLISAYFPDEPKRIFWLTFCADKATSQYCPPKGKILCSSYHDSTRGNSACKAISGLSAPSKALDYGHTNRYNF
jgi:type IV pilus assembly protein PilE